MSPSAPTFKCGNSPSHVGFSNHLLEALFVLPSCPDIGLWAPMACDEAQSHAISWCVRNTFVHVPSGDKSMLRPRARSASPRIQPRQCTPTPPSIAPQCPRAFHAFSQQTLAGLAQGLQWVSQRLVPSHGTEQKRPGNRMKTFLPREAPSHVLLAHRLRCSHVHSDPPLLATQTGNSGGRALQPRVKAARRESLKRRQSPSDISQLEDLLQQHAVDVKCMRPLLKGGAGHSTPPSSTSPIASVELNCFDGWHDRYLHSCA